MLLSHPAGSHVLWLGSNLWVQMSQAHPIGHTQLCLWGVAIQCRVGEAVVESPGTISWQQGVELGSSPTGRSWVTVSPWNTPFWIGKGGVTQLYP